MRIVIDNTALFSQKNGVYRYSECIINGLKKTLGSDNIKLFPAPKIIEYFNNKNQFEKEIEENFDWFNLYLSKKFCNLKDNIVSINSNINKNLNNSLIINNKVKRETLRVLKNTVECLFNDTKIIQKSLKDSQIYHCLYGYIPDAVKKIPNLQLCITVHDIIPILHPNLIEGGKKYCNFRETNQIKQLTGKEIIFTVSQHSKNDLCNFNKKLDPSNVYVTHLAASKIFQKVFDSEIINKLKEKLGIPLDSKYIVSTLSSDPKKNVCYVVNAFLDLINSEKIDDLKLVLTGKKTNLLGLSKVLCEKIEQNKDKIILTDYIEDEETAILFSGAMCFCFPSLYEGFGLPVLEAMQCGTPIITSNVSSLPEIAGGAACLVNPLNDDEFKQSILDIKNNFILRKTMSEKGLKRASEFSWEKCTNEMIKVYSSYL